MDNTSDPLLSAIYEPDRALTASEAGDAARERAKARLMEKVSNAEELLVGLEHHNAARTDPRLLRAARTRFWPRWLAHWARPWLDGAAPDVMSRIAERAEARGDTERARSWEDAIVTARIARVEHAEMADLSDRAVSDVRALDLTRAVDALAAVADDMRADGLGDEADVFLVRLEGLGRLTPPALLPYSDVVDRLPAIGSKPSARRRWDAACSWIAENRPHLLNEIRDILAA